jgi:hypothetical protein
MLDVNIWVKIWARHKFTFGLSTIPLVTLPIAAESMLDWLMVITVE